MDNLCSPILQPISNLTGSFRKKGRRKHSALCPSVSHDTLPSLPYATTIRHRSLDTLIAVPILPPTFTSMPFSRMGSIRAASSRSRMGSNGLWSLMFSIRIVNSSPPRRAAISLLLRQPSTLWAMVRSVSSPAA